MKVRLGLAVCLLIIRVSPVLAAGDATGINKIQHIIIIVQEDRSFDHYFGTFPGADGITLDQYGLAKAQIPDQWLNRYDNPYHYPNFPNRNWGGPHNVHAAQGDIDGGRMDGFMTEAEWDVNGEFSPLQWNKERLEKALDVLGYYDSADIPGYWNLAHRFVLQDHLFQSNMSGGLPSHLYLVSGWSAFAPDTNPMHAQNAPLAPNAPWRWHPLQSPKTSNVLYSWTDITWLLHRQNVDWAYYYTPGAPDDWIPLRWFATVHEDNQLGNIRPISDFRTAARDGTLPAVCWIVPNFEVSEHPQATVSAGEQYVTDLVNTIMNSPEWSSTAIFITWDNWGGFYDHAVPPKVDDNGYGLRVPGMVISPYAKKGYIDHQMLSFDAYLKFIEDRFLNGQRLDPWNDGRPDARTSVRENAPQLGNLINDFDFSQTPGPALPLR